MSGALLAAGAFAVFGRSFSVPLLLDDYLSIRDNATIRYLRPLWQVLSPPNSAGVGGRPLLNLSYALNYRFGGTATFGYHFVNLLIHVLAGWTLFGLVRRTLLKPILAGRFGSVATPLALAISAIWMWHPVQTESVTYLSQRAESLMGLFYLLTLYCFVRYVEAEEEAKAWRLPPPSGPPSPVGLRRGSFRIAKAGSRQAFVRAAVWFGLSVLSCLAGVATKEVIMTAPLMVLLYDRTFISFSFGSAWRRHWPLYLALATTWLLLAELMVGLHYRSVGFGQGIAWWAYGVAECRAVTKYLLLAFWPQPLVFDYGPKATARLSEVWPYALALASLLAITGWALLERRAAHFRSLGFAGAWFFLILAPTSSIVPVVTQPMAENRMYLPLAGIVALFVLGAFVLAGRWSWAVFACVAAALGLAAAQRNRAYASERSIWADTVAKSPGNPRAHNELGLALERIPGQLPESIAQFREALRLQPDFAEAHNNLGNVWLAQPGRSPEAVAQFEEALRLRPDYPEAHYNLGRAWSTVAGRLTDAMAQDEEAFRLRPDYPEAHNNLGNALATLPGRMTDAIAQYEEALRLDPDYAEAHNNLGNAWLKLPGHSNEAIGQFEAALRLKPDFPEAHFDLGNAWLGLPGRLHDAIAQYETAVRLKPDYVEAHVNLGTAWASMPGHLNDAIAEYQRALRLKPDYPEAHNNLGSLWLYRPGHLTEAIAQYEEALRLNPDYADAHLNLAVALLKIPGREEEARGHLEAVLRLQPENTRARQILAGSRASREKAP